MRRALSYIADQQKAFAGLPFFEYLRDETVGPEVRFLFTPAVAPFVMAFADLNNFVLRVPTPAQPLEELINRHSEEDATHYQMYLQDLETLGFDTPGSFKSVLTFLWAEPRKQSRETCYALTALLAEVPVRLRLVILEAMESAGAAAFEVLGELAEQYRAVTGKELQFFGRRHKELETGHAMGSADVEQELHAVVLTEDELRRSRPLVDRVFQIFAAMMAELHGYGLERAALRRASLSCASTG